MNINDYIFIVTLFAGYVKPGGNEEILKRSETLGAYSAFVERVRGYQGEGLTLRDAIHEAITWGIENGVLSSFLANHGSEVENMLYTEFNIDVAKQVWQREAREDGKAEGEAKGKDEYFWRALSWRRRITPSRIT